MSINQELSREEVKWLRFDLPPMADEDFDAFVALVNRLIIIQPLISPDDRKNRLTPKELKGELTKVKKHYERAAKGLAYLSKQGIQPKIIDQHYGLANLSFPHCRQDKADEGLENVVSDVENETRNFIKALESFESSVQVASGRSQDKRFHLLILEIAKFFKQKLPGSAISSGTETNFSRVITYLVTKVLSTRLAESQSSLLKDLKRRIDDAINELSTSE